MKQLSYWAKHHPQTARLLIILLHLPLTIAGIVTGLLIFDFNVSLGQSFIFTVITITTVLFFFERKKASYYTRKFLHLSMAICTYLLLVFAGNQLRQSKPYFPFSQTIHAVGTSSLPTTISHTEQTKEKKPEHKLTRKQSKKLLKKIDRENKLVSPSAKVLLIVLAVIVASVLLYVLAGLACNLSCNGSEALAIIVLLTGGFGIIFGATRLIQFILGKKRRDKISTSSAD